VCLLNFGSQFGVENVYLDWPTIPPVTPTIYKSLHHIFVPGPGFPSYISLFIFNAKNMTSIKAQHYIQLFKMDTVLVITEESTGDASIIIYVITIHGQTTRNMSEFC
jgi:hypothetical protein